MKVTDIIAQATGPLFTFELLPPLKGQTIHTIYEAIETLLPYNPAYINITNHQTEVIYVDRPDNLVERRTVRKRPGTLGLSAAIQYKYGIPVVPHLICGGQTKEQLEDLLVELNFLGIDNVLALRGDPPHGERRFIPEKGGYAHTDGMVSQIEACNCGEFLDPSLRDPQPFSFCIGVAGYPEKHAEAPNMEYDIAMLKRKIDAGAHYIVTQMFFDNNRFFSFVDQCRKAGIDVPIIPGIKPIQRERDLALLPQTFHVDLPPALVSSIERCKSPAEIRKVGVKLCSEQVSELLAAKVVGVHFYTQGRSDSIAKIVEATYPKQ